MILVFLLQVIGFHVFLIPHPHLAVLQSEVYDNEIKTKQKQQHKKRETILAESNLLGWIIDLGQGNYSSLAPLSLSCGERQYPNLAPSRHPVPPRGEGRKLNVPFEVHKQGTQAHCMMQT